MWEEDHLNSTADIPPASRGLAAGIQENHVVQQFVVMLFVMKLIEVIVNRIEEIIGNFGYMLMTINKHTSFINFEEPF